MTGITWSPAEAQESPGGARYPGTSLRPPRWLLLCGATSVIGGSGPPD